MGKEELEARLLEAHAEKLRSETIQISKPEYKKPHTLLGAATLLVSVFAIFFNWGLYREIAQQDREIVQQNAEIEEVNGSLRLAGEKLDAALTEKRAIASDNAQLREKLAKCMNEPLPPAEPRLAIQRHSIRREGGIVFGSFNITVANLQPDGSAEAECWVFYQRMPAGSSAGPHDRQIVQLRRTGENDGNEWVSVSRLYYQLNESQWGEVHVKVLGKDSFDETVAFDWSTPNT